MDFKVDPLYLALSFPFFFFLKKIYLPFFFLLIESFCLFVVISHFNIWLILNCSS